jgi:predicted Zn-dependent protease
MEIEADRIGMLLLAAAGFDPYIAVEVEEKLGQIGGNSELQNYLSTHPSSTKRAKCLLQDKVMEEALELYRESSVSKAETASSWSKIFKLSY